MFQNDVLPAWEKKKWCHSGKQQWNLARFLGLTPWVSAGWYRRSIGKAKRHDAALASGSLPKPQRHVTWWHSLWFCFTSQDVHLNKMCFPSLLLLQRKCLMVMPKKGHQSLLLWLAEQFCCWFSNQGGEFLKSFVYTALDRLILVGPYIPRYSKFQNPPQLLSSLLQEVYSRPGAENILLDLKPLPEPAHSLVVATKPCHQWESLQNLLRCDDEHLSQWLSVETCHLQLHDVLVGLVIPQVGAILCCNDSIMHGPQPDHDSVSRLVLIVLFGC